MHRNRLAQSSFFSAFTHKIILDIYQIAHGPHTILSGVLAGRVSFIAQVRILEINISLHGVNETAVLVGELYGFLEEYGRLRRVDVSLDGDMGDFERVVIAAIRKWTLRYVEKPVVRLRVGGDCEARVVRC